MIQGLGMVAEILTLLAALLLSAWIFRRRGELAKLMDVGKVEGSWGGGLVSVIIPVRNSADILPKCLESLLSQRDVRFEAIIVDDSSSDSSLEVAERYADDVRVKVVSAGEKPEGWTGKTWACHKGFLNSRGGILVFMDSDTLLEHEHSLLNALKIKEGAGVDVLSLYPRFRLETMWERLWTPFMANFVYIIAPPSRVNSREHRESFLMGAFSVFSREVYEAVGGHEAVRMEIVEDKALGDRVKSRGFRFMLAYGSGISTRWAGGVRESWNALKRILSISGKLKVITGAVSLPLVFILPPAILAYSLITWNIFQLSSSLLAVALSLILQGLELRRNGYSPVYALGFPLAAAFTSLCMVWVLLRRRMVIEWRGRRYTISS